jgi:hypothetical protein
MKRRWRIERTVRRNSLRIFTLLFTTSPVTSCRDVQYCIRVFSGFTVKRARALMSFNLSPNSHS